MLFNTTVIWSDALHDILLMFPDLLITFYASIACDPMIWEYPLGMIHIVRSHYSTNFAYRDLCGSANVQAIEVQLYIINMLFNTTVIWSDALHDILLMFPDLLITFYASIACDPMIWEYPLGMIHIVRSHYSTNFAYRDLCGSTPIRS